MGFQRRRQTEGSIDHIGSFPLSEPTGEKMHRPEKSNMVHGGSCWDWDSSLCVGRWWNWCSFCASVCVGHPRCYFKRWMLLVCFDMNFLFAWLPYLFMLDIYLVSVVQASLVGVNCNSLVQPQCLTCFPASSVPLTGFTKSKPSILNSWGQYADICSWNRPFSLISQHLDWVLLLPV